MKKKMVVVEVICSLLILLFVYAGISKLLDYETFRYQLGKSPYISEMANYLSWSLPAIEVVIAFMLVFNTTRLLGLYFSFGIMFMFTIYIYCMLNYSYYVPCSCGGVLSQLTWDQHLVFNVAFTVLALVGIVILGSSSRQKSRMEISSI